MVVVAHGDLIDLVLQALLAGVDGPEELGAARRFILVTDNASRSEVRIPADPAAPVCAARTPPHPAPRALRSSARCWPWSSDKHPATSPHTKHAFRWIRGEQCHGQRMCTLRGLRGAQRMVVFCFRPQTQNGAHSGPRPVPPLEPLSPRPGTGAPAVS